MNKINEINIQIKLLEEVKDKERNKEITKLQAIRFREQIRMKIFDILDTEAYVLGK